MSYLGRSAKLSLKAQEKVSFLATAGQTVKTGLSYTPSFIEVYVNGVLLTDTTDYTATNGNSITFTVALLLNDEVTVISLKTFTVADHYSKTEADTLLAAKSPIASPVFTGNVGIGGTPTRNLLVKGASTEASLLLQNSSTGVTSTDGVLLQSNSNNSYLWNYESGDMILATNNAERLRIDSSGNVGIGVVPEATHSSADVLQVGGTALIANWEDAETYVGENVYISTAGTYKYLTTSHASLYNQNSGKHVFQVAPSGSADAAISWTTAMNISAAGIVTKPLQPCFSATRTSNQTVSTSTITLVELNIREFDIGNNFNTSTYRFTAPVAGKYLFTAAIQFNNNGGVHTNLYVNGGSRNDGWLDFGTTTASSQSRIFDLVSGDYVQLYTYAGSISSPHIAAGRVKMTGFLIG